MPPTGTTEGLDTAMIIRDEMPKVWSSCRGMSHAMRLLATGRAVGYLLKTRVSNVSDFPDTLSRIASCACVIDPALIQELADAPERNDPLAVLSPREKRCSP
jgi:hypothetical protein